MSTCACGFRGSDAELRDHLELTQDDKTRAHYKETPTYSTCSCGCGCEPDGDWHWSQQPWCTCVSQGCSCVTDTEAHKEAT